SVASDRYSPSAIRYVANAIAKAPNASAETARATSTPRTRLVKLDKPWSAIPHPARLAMSNAFNDLNRRTTPQAFQDARRRAATASITPRVRRSRERDRWSRASGHG